MRMGEFIQEHCKDIIEKADQRAELIETIDFPYDECIQDVTGEDVKVIKVDNCVIPIHDILMMGEADFSKTYASEACREAYHKYLDNFIILEGEDVLNEIRNDLKLGMERIKRYSDISYEDLL